METNEFSLITVAMYPGRVKACTVVDVWNVMVQGNACNVKK
jgi:hypothetical protein